MKNKKRAKFDFDNINPIKFRLLDKQVDIILRALELYLYNLEYMLDCEKTEDEERQKKFAMLKYTYEQVRYSKIEQTESREVSSILGINKTENKILNLIRGNNYITRPEIAKILNLSENCIYRNIKSLRDKNIINRVGANKNGYWEVKDKFRDNCRDNNINFDMFIN